MAVKLFRNTFAHSIHVGTIWKHLKISWFSVDVKAIIIQLSKEGTWSLNICHCNQTRIFTYWYFKFSETIKDGGGGALTVKIQNLAFLQHLQLQLALT